MDEKEFLAGLNRKEERAWKELYDYFYSPLCVYSSRIAGDGTAAEDIVQDCLVKLWHSTVCFEEMKVLTSYLYRSVYHATLNEMRGRERAQRLHKRWTEEVMAEGEAQVAALEEETITRFYKVLGELPAQQREILLLCMKDKKVREIAELLDVTENTVKTQKKRAYEFVRDRMGDLWTVAVALLFA